MSVKIDQALVSAFIAGGFGLSIAHENAPFEPAGQTPYAEIKVLQNDITAGTLNDTNDSVTKLPDKYGRDCSKE
jgi:hypothetical protein